MTDVATDTHTTATMGRPQLEYWPIDRLVPSPRNARTHSPAQVAEIAGSIRAFGFTNPILAGADGDVIAGHGRLAAARQWVSLSLFVTLHQLRGRLPIREYFVACWRLLGVL